MSIKKSIKRRNVRSRKWGRALGGQYGSDVGKSIEENKGERVKN